MMRAKLTILFCLWSVMLLSSSFTHKTKLTSSLIEYDDKTGNIKMECRVFIDDFEESIKQRFAKNINVSNLTEEDELAIKKYFDLFYKISINGKKLALNYKSSQIHQENNVLTITFSENKLAIKKGDYLLVKNTLFFEEFGDTQVNNISIVIPPFWVEYNYQATIHNYTYSHTF